VLAGYQKKSQVLSDKEKLIVAYHETGHALVAAKQKESAPVHKITIIPRTSGALGYTMQVEEDEHFLTSKEEIENKIATYTAGRVAEDVVFGAITTGAANDIERATQLARAMITRLGMTDEFGMVSFEQEVNPYLGGQTVSTGSAETSSRVDQMTIDLVKKQYDRAETIIRDNLPKLHELAKFLYEKETISGEEFMSILNSPPALLTQETEAQEGEEQSAPAQV
jgi:cell division protease FtsH